MCPVGGVQGGTDNENWAAAVHACPATVLAPVTMGCTMASLTSDRRVSRTGKA